MTLVKVRVQMWQLTPSVALESKTGWPYFWWRSVTSTILVVARNFL
jgi:hypothetical protein